MEMENQSNNFQKSKTKRRYYFLIILVVVLVIISASIGTKSIFSLSLEEKIYEIQTRISEIMEYIRRVFKSSPTRSKVAMINNWCNGTDINRDGKVDNDDLDLVNNNLGRTDCLLENNWCQKTDINQDGKVNSVDVSYINDYKGRIGCEGCYIEIKINENKNREGSIDFSLAEVRNFTGLADGLIPDRYREDAFYGDYILTAYDKDNKIIDSYSLNSSRFILWDNFDEEAEIPGGIKELDFGIITVVIPFDYRIEKIKIKDNDIETDLGDISPYIECRRTCKTENQRGDFSKEERCCFGLTPVIQPNNSFICVNCGDNICSPYENIYSCPEDCSG